MRMFCDPCGCSYDDEHCSTVCPHKGIGYCAVCDCVICVCTPETTGRRWARSNSNQEDMSTDERSDTVGAMTPMPQYQSHKKVWALKISKVHRDEDGQGIAITFEDKTFSVRAFTADQLKGKPTPEPGWYMVQYEDGYISFSPEKAFEEGYTLVGPKKRPTIEELEKILNSEENSPITVNPDGSITA